MQLRLLTFFLLLSYSLAVQATAADFIERDKDDRTTSICYAESTHKDLTQIEALYDAVSNEKSSTKERVYAYSYLAEYAKKGHSLAQAYMSLFFLQGVEGVIGKDKKACFEMAQKSWAWLSIKAPEGVPEAQIIFGVMLYDGFYGACRQDPELGISYLCIAASKGYRDAIHNLKVILLREKNSRRDIYLPQIYGGIACGFDFDEYTERRG